MAITTTRQKYERYFPFILLLITISAYANTLTHGFVLDDEAVLTQNRFVQKGLAGIPDIFTTFYWQGYWDLNAGLYRPLSLIMLAIEWQVSPNNPLIHHLVQVLLYGAAVVLFYRFLSKLLAGHAAIVPFAVALLFVVHPLHTEVVANIKSRDELLCFLFFILSANDILEHQKVTIKATVFFLLSLLSKEIAVAFLPVLMLMLVQFRKTEWKDVLRTSWPLAVTLISWLLWRGYVLNNAPQRVPYTHADNALLACDGKLTQIATAVSITGRYMLKIIYPVHLSYDYSYNQIPCADLASGYLWLSILLTGALLWIAVKTFRSNPAVSFGILFFFITASIVSNIFLIIGSTMAERFMFTPLAGLLIAGVTALARHSTESGKAKLPQAGIIATVAVAFVFSLLTIRRNEAWASNAVLFETDVATSPQSARTHYNYGTALLNMSPSPENPAQYQDALRELEQAYAIDPADLNTKINLGVALYKNGQYNKAVTVFREALKQSPNHYRTVLNLADAYVKLNAWDSAAVLYQTALDHNTYQPNTHNFYGMVLFSLKDYPKAAAIYAAGLKIYPDNAELWMNYGNALGIQNEFEKAIQAFTKAYELDNTKKQALYFLALTYNSIGDIEKSEVYLKMYNTK